VPTLLELQNALRRSLVDRDDGEAAAMLAAHVAPDRLDIYRNTFLSSLTKTLRLSYPAIHRLVGDDFFEVTAGALIVETPPVPPISTNTARNFPNSCCVSHRPPGSPPCRRSPAWNGRSAGQSMHLTWNRSSRCG
jgi:hypothetical protein